MRQWADGVLDPATGGRILATGWEPDLAPADSLVRQAVLAHASWAIDAARRAGKPWYDGDTWAGGIPRRPRTADELGRAEATASIRPR